jgi:GH24 family phage-related lysozyme (muramidase)
MNISENGIALIKKFEGLELRAYKPVPQETYYTIGYGHCGQDVQQHQVITEEQADSFLRHDLATAVTGVNELVKVPVNQNQFDALVSFSFNCGYQALKGSTLLSDINAKNYASASLEFGKWVHGSGGVILQGLVDRREAEKELFLKPVPHPILLEVGSKGEDVAFVQRFLGIPDDGIFGEQTKEAVIKYQQMRGLTQDGIVGPVTWNEMHS